MIDFKIIKNWDSKLKCLDFVIFLARTQKLTNQKRLFLFVLFVKKLNLAHTALNNFKESSAGMHVRDHVRYSCPPTSNVGPSQLPKLQTSKFKRSDWPNETFIF